MKPIILTEPRDIQAFLGRLEQRMPGEDLLVRQAVTDVIADVRMNGEEAVLRLRERFEGVKPDQILVARPRLDREARRYFEERASRAPDAFRASLSAAARRVRAYHEIQQDNDRSLSEPGAADAGGAIRERARMTSRVQPLDRVAIYVPGGKAFYPSSLLMSLVPAQVAGVSRIAVVTPHRSLDNPAFAAACLDLGVDEVLATGGAQGVAAAAFGMASFERCDKIVGPGNAYVATAKHLLSGRIGIDSFAGPSEILILGDGTSPAEWVVADLLAQAEHDEEASAVLVTTSRQEAEAVSVALEAGFQTLKDRGAIARRAWERFGAIICVNSEAEQVRIANEIHAEHLHVHTAAALTDEGRRALSQSLRGVGAVFFGRYCAEVFGDYMAGPSHVLPTAGTARFASPLGVYDFVRRSSLLWMTSELASELSEPTAVLADAEELWGHARAARLRCRDEAGARAATTGSTSEGRP